MSLESAKEYLKQFGKDQDVRVMDESSATVELAAKAVGVEPELIAKTLAFADGDSIMLILAAGTARVDNKKFKEQFGFKARMGDFEKVLEMTGHAFGGVCPFGLPNELRVFLDASLKQYPVVYPACGSSNSCVMMTLDELEKCSKSLSYVDVCK